MPLGPCPFALVPQRVSSASVTIDDTVRGAIERGLLILLGVADIRVRGHPENCSCRAILDR